MDDDIELSIAGKLMLPAGPMDGCIGITDGRIRAIKKVLEGEEHRDMSGCLVVPSAVDMHVHFRQPGLVEKGDFRTESRAAAFGGVTTVADMPNTRPPAVDEASWLDKVEGIAGNSFVDYLLYMGMRPDCDIARLGRVTGLFKLYTASTTGDLLVSDVPTWTGLLAGVAEAGGRVTVHAEDQATIERARPRGRGLHRHDSARPALGEAAAVKRVVLVAASTGHPGRVHIAHLSCRESLAAFAGSGCSAEVTPHHLFLDRRMEELRAFGKVNPPLRSDEDRAALWAALADGRIPIMASDHAPHTREEKLQSFEDAPSGMPGVETMVPMAMALARDGRISMERLVDATATRPAAFLGIGRRALEVGAEAHIAVYGPRDVVEVSASRLHAKCGWTPFEGRPAIFPRLVIGPGGILIDEWEIQQSKPQGRYVGLALKAYRELDEGRRPSRNGVDD